MDERLFHSHSGRREGTWYHVKSVGIKDRRYEDRTHTEYKHLSTYIKIIHWYDFASGRSKFRFWQRLGSGIHHLSQVRDAISVLPGCILFRVSHYVLKNSPQPFPFLPETIRSILTFTAYLHGASYFQLCVHTDAGKNNSGEQSAEMFP